MMFFCSSDKLLNHCAKFLIASTVLFILGVNVSNKDEPKSAPASLRLLVAIVASSHGSCVSSNVSDTTEP